MGQRVLGTAAAMVIAMPAVLPVGIGTAGAEGATFVTLTQIFRRCDYSTNAHIGPTGVGRPTALVHLSGSEVITDVVIVMAIPDTPYDVRVIQMPRSSASGCNAGDPGVVGGVLMTDGGGAGGVSLHAPIVSGATGAWIYITRPGEFSQTPAEFYTSDFVVPISAR